MSGYTETVRELSASIDALAAGVLGDGQTVVELHRQLERLSAVVAKAVAAFDAGGSWEADGARTAAAWVGTRCRLPLGVARRRVSLGRSLRHMGRVEAAWLAGEIGEAQVEVLAQARQPGTEEAFERDERLLVAQAAELRYSHFCRAVAYWRHLNDPDGVEDEAEAQHAARRLHVSETFGGVRVIDGVLDPIGGGIFAAALRKIEDELFAADWAEARGRVGEGVRATDLSRAPSQRRADALVEMARRAGAVPEGARIPEPLVTVLVGYETLAGRVCELANGTVVSPGSVLRLLDQSWVERVVFDGPDRVMGVGVRRRFFDGATRRAIEVRDRECFSQFCEAPASHCEVDHVRPWSAGGLTTQANGQLACGYHNRWRSRRRGPP
ncbi:MAG: DUF222 domain-containing protein [Acidimicrobiales bacterium]